MKKLIVLLYLALILPVVAEAQLDAVGATTSATSAQSNDVDIVEEDSRWFEVDRIFGRVDVGDFVVGPGRNEVTVQPGQTITEYITVTNRISGERSFKLEVADIAGSVDGSSALSVIEDQPGPYSIRDYISFPEDVITLELGERARLPMTISVPRDAEPGGFYGTVLVSTVRTGSPGGSGTVPTNPIIARVGSHVFLTVEGDINRLGALESLSTLPSQWWYESGPVTFAVAYQNQGSVHLNPYGELRIKNTFGADVGRVEIEPWFVLPQSLRNREITWERELLFGRYTAELTLNRGYDDIIDTEHVVFWVLPWRYMLGIFLGVFGVLFLIRLFFRTFEFKRKV